MTISDKYLNESESISNIIADVDSRSNALRQAQDNEHELKMLAAKALEDKKAMAETLCQTTSEQYGLKTPITVVELGNLDIVELADIPNIVNTTAKICKEREDAAMATAQQVNIFTETEPSGGGSVTTTILAEVEEVAYYKTLTINFTEMTKSASFQLLDFLKQNNITYTVEGKEVYPNE